MNISVIPARCIRSSDELRQIERQLNIQEAEIETVIEGLKRSEDESMMLLSAKLSKTLEELHSRVRFTRMMHTAMTKIASVYAKTEDGVDDYENAGFLRQKARYVATTISRNKMRAEKTFDRL